LAAFLFSKWMTMGMMTAATSAIKP
jgi:hypothetical protein